VYRSSVVEVCSCPMTATDVEAYACATWAGQ
jgi:hypothetical protein